MTAAPATDVASAYPPAGPDRRFYAYALDRLVAWPLVAAGCWLGHLLSWREGEVWPGAGVALAAVLVVGLAFATGLGLAGVSPGKAVTGLRVVDPATGAPIGVGRALQRTLVLAAAGLPTFGLGVATLAHTAVMDPARQRRGWHDRVTGSIVVDVRPVTVAGPAPDEAPRQVVNLTAMRLAPASAVPAPVVVPPRHTGEAEPVTPPAPTSPRPLGPPLVSPPAVAGWRVTFDTGESLLVEGLTLLGRKPEGRPGEPVRQLVPLRSADLSVSKTHALLDLGPDGTLVVMDRGSTNGSSLVRAGVPRELPPGRAETLLPGDTVRFGDRSVTIAREP
jgi:uncharacterized RDD family membrane protein YckC